MNSHSTPRRRDAIFDSDFLDGFGRWPLAYIPAGGADIGDIVAEAEAEGGGDESVFYDAWMAAGDAKAAAAQAALDGGHRLSARGLFLRASCMYAAAYKPLFGTPVDPRLLAAHDKQMAAFKRGMELSAVPVRPGGIPFEGGELPAYLAPAAGREPEVRPLLVLNNGFDATITDLYFTSAVAAIHRDYHVLMSDGPGQGSMLYHSGVPLRPDWEKVISAVVDYAETVDIVDPTKIALSGWSLGGYLAPRAATGEPRLAACIADPGQWDIGESIRGLLATFGVPDADTINPADLVDATVDQFLRVIESSPGMRWQIIQRGFWATGTSDLRGFLDTLMRFTLKDKVGDIRCPTLLSSAENDPLASTTREFYTALACPKELLEFTAAEVAGEHCEMGNRSLLNQRVLDWLDDVLETA